MGTFLLVVIVIVILIIIVNSASSKQREEKRTYRETRPTIKVEISYAGVYYDDERRLKGPAADPEKLWVPPGQTVAVSKYQIPGGMIYVGKNLATKSGYVDPALINPDLPVDSANPDRLGSSMSYWPSYSSISPRCRAAYLEWLAACRRTPETNMGYVFLFFYGLERRLLLDAQSSPKARAEAATIINEVEQLLEVYGENSSFSNYANGFLAYARLTFLEDSYDLNPERLQRSWYFPLELKLALARFAEKQQPLPANWALAWAELDPQKWFRTPAHRCREEFVKLFATRYSKKFGDGMILKPNKVKIKVEYRPASSGFYGSPVYKEIDKPDITALSLPLQQLHKIAESCIDDLDAYSRFIGRKPEERKSLSALALLPDEIIHSVEANEIHTLGTFLEKATVGGTSPRIIPAKDVLKYFGFHDKTKLTKAEIISVAGMIGKLGYAIIPDVRFDEGRLEPAQPILLSRSSVDPEKLSSGNYNLATMIMNLAVSVSAADDVVSTEERLLLESHVEKMLDLSEAEKARLRLHLEWLLNTKPDFSGLRKKFAELEKVQRETIASTLISIANADGVVHPQEIKALERVYKVLNLNSERIYSDIHEAQTQDKDELTLVVTTKAKRGGLKIPRKEKRVLIDEKKVERTLKNTKEVQAILAQVFASNEENIETTTTFGGGILDLDMPHSNLLRELLGKPKWSRNEIEALCTKYEILPSGAIETINERSYEILNEGLIEDGDEIVVNLELAKEIKS
jgi:tellurite resistance protein